MKSALKYGIWLYFAAAVAYVGYSWYSYTGLYRLAAEWQMAAFGSYSIKMTLLIPLLIAIIPGAVAAKLLGVQDQMRRSADALNVATSPRIMAAIGIVLLIAAAGAGWYGFGKASEKVEFETFDLAKAAAPKSTHVVMTGVAHTEYLLEFQTKSGGTTKVDRYVPLTAATWRRGDPLTYFMKTNATAYMPPGGGKLLEFSQRTPPFQMTTQPGVLISDDLPGPIAEIYRKHGVALASSPVVLDLNPSADVEPYFISAGVGGLVGLICLVVAGATTMRQRRLPQI